MASVDEHDEYLKQFMGGQGLTLERDIPEKYGQDYGEGDSLRFLNDFKFFSYNRSEGMKLQELETIGGSDSPYLYGVGTVVLPPSAENIESLGPFKNPLDVYLGWIVEWCIDANPPGLWVKTEPKQGKSSWYLLLKPSAEYERFYLPLFKKFSLFKTLSSILTQYTSYKKVSLMLEANQFSQEDIRASSSFLLQHMGNLHPEYDNSEFMKRLAQPASSAKRSSSSEHKRKRQDSDPNLYSPSFSKDEHKARQTTKPLPPTTTTTITTSTTTTTSNSSSGPSLLSFFQPTTFDSLPLTTTASLSTFSSFSSAKHSSGEEGTAEGKEKRSTRGKPPRKLVDDLQAGSLIKTRTRTRSSSSKSSPSPTSTSPPTPSSPAITKKRPSSSNLSGLLSGSTSTTTTTTTTSSSSQPRDSTTTTTSSSQNTANTVDQHVGSFSSSGRTNSANRLNSSETRRSRNPPPEPEVTQATPQFRELDLPTYKLNRIPAAFLMDSMSNQLLRCPLCDFSEMAPRIEAFLAHVEESHYKPLQSQLTHAEKRKLNLRTIFNQLRIRTFIEDLEEEAGKMDKFPGTQVLFPVIPDRVESWPHVENPLVVDELGSQPRNKKRSTGLDGPAWQ